MFYPETWVGTREKTWWYVFTMYLPLCLGQFLYNDFLGVSSPNQVLKCSICFVFCLNLCSHPSSLFVNHSVIWRRHGLEHAMKVGQCFTPQSMD